MTKKMNLFIPITKVDEEKRLVYGVATAEQPDNAGEICDYETTAPYYKAWSEKTEKITQGKSKGILRSMHKSIPAGKIVDIFFDDDQKKIEICGKVVDDKEWNKVLEGVYTGFSQGGKYVKTWKDGAYTRYTADPCEVSLVDIPCLPTATFSLLRSSGAVEVRKFKEGTMDAEPKQVWLAKNGKTFSTKAEAVSENAKDVEKGMGEVMSLAEIIQRFADLQRWISLEAEIERDGSDIPRKMKDAIGVINQIFIELANEELAELTISLGGDMSEGAEKVEKKGAKISAATKGHITKMLKSAQDHIGVMKECMKELGVEYEDGVGEDGKEDEEKAEKAVADEVAKKEEEEKAKKEAEEKEKAEKEKVEKAELEDKLEKANKTNNETTTLLKSMSAELQKAMDRIKALEEQPATTPKGKVFAVGKDGHEVRGEVSKTGRPDEDVNYMGKYSPAEFRSEFNFQ